MSPPGALVFLAGLFVWIFTFAGIHGVLVAALVMIVLALYGIDRYEY